VVAALIHNVKFTDEYVASVMQLQEKLHSTHCRNRRKASIGIHDADKLNFPLHYTAKDPTFEMIPLDISEKMSLSQILETHPKGVKYAHIINSFSAYPIILDGSDRPISFPPIINAEMTRVTEKTRNLLIEVTALDLKTAEEVLAIVSTAFAERGGNIEAIRIIYRNKTMITPQLDPWRMDLGISYVKRILGIDLSPEEIIECLSRMGYDVEQRNSGILTVYIPRFRTDVMHPIDLVEDVAIAYGYEKFKPEIPKISTVGQEAPIETFSHILRNLMVGYGFQEVITFILSNERKLFDYMLLERQPVAETLNPKTEEYNVVRNWLLPSLMEVLKRNVHNEYPQRLFEVGDVVLLDSSYDTGSKACKRMAGVVSHAKMNFTEIKSIVDSIFANLGLSPEYKPSDLNCFIRGRCADIYVNKSKIGFMGEIRPEVLLNWGLANPVAGFELDVDLLLKMLTGIG